MHDLLKTYVCDVCGRYFQSYTKFKDTDLKICNQAHDCNIYKILIERNQEKK